MTIVVSRGAVTVDGKKACSRCKKRPRRPGQRYCRECATDYSREWREGTVERRLTPAEWAKVQKSRQPRRPESRQRTELVALRLLPAERAELEARAAQLGASLSEVIRAGALRFARIRRLEVDGGS